MARILLDETNITSFPIKLPIELRQIIIQAPIGVATILEGKLRSKYEVRIEAISNNPKAVCQIFAKKNRKWIKICSFASDENVKDIITMFEVNFQLRR